mmetsp:Transcript_35187/g.88527  ORF Transcript_35187/g.88527 Transcript_35187/m.88527 type:complete len:1089 (-) Transcript_35187:25-3291(-)|eukprot:CAMPEP_0177659456 /NCGR_PEP_ID=MMETSP0447-20121125/17452_1 /TAXON_ID=0 /ORGANISM="Stygamoeba regulata, Strain BSH-02190019" /LENGTH=1088 /DNA_ID=CAMNT_0019164327 /DNA_START=164 /DNA_END=3430 /DNA_ORIENTATION=-
MQAESCTHRGKAALYQYDASVNAWVCLNSSACTVLLLCSGQQRARARLLVLLPSPANRDSGLPTVALLNQSLFPSLHASREPAHFVQWRHQTGVFGLSFADASAAADFCGHLQRLLPATAAASGDAAASSQTVRRLLDEAPPLRATTSLDSAQPRRRTVNLGSGIKGMMRRRPQSTMDGQPLPDDLTDTLQVAGSSSVDSPSPRSRSRTTTPRYENPALPAPGLVRPGATTATSAVPPGMARPPSMSTPPGISTPPVGHAPATGTGAVSASALNEALGSADASSSSAAASSSSASSSSLLSDASSADVAGAPPGMSHAPPKSLRDKHAWEIWETEVAYCNTLDKIVDLCLKPARRLQIFSPVELKTIFCNVEVIRTLNKNFVAQLKERMDAWSEEQLLGDVFLSMIPFFKVYTEYYKNYEAVPDLLAALAKKKEIAAFLNDSTIMSATDGHGLPNLLIQPCQRLLRYSLLLRELLKETSESHPDFQNLTQALDKVREAADFMNRSVSAVSNDRLVEQLMRDKKHYVGFDDILAPHRSLVASVDASVPVGPITYSWVLVFNDLLVLCTEVAQARTFKNRDEQPIRQVGITFPLHTVWVDGMSEQGVSSSDFRLVTPEDTFLATTKTPNLKSSFMKAATRAVLEQVQRREAGELDKRSFVYSFQNGSHYSGEWLVGVVEGRGCMTYSSGHVYEGELIKGKPHGTGVMKYKGGGSYEGQWLDGAHHGQGTLESPFGDRYEGQWERGAKHGQGTLRWQSGDSYEGEWHEDHMHGKGKLTLVSCEATYEGQFQLDAFHGDGSLTWHSGRYEGQFVASHRQGQGKMVGLDKSEYQGEWFADQPHGQGRWQSEDRRCSYEGEWSEGKPHGQGKLLREDRESYEGQLKEGRQHGSGLAQWPGGATYDGGWADGRRTGQGKACGYLGDLYDGHWHNDKRFGRGVATSVDGSRYEGEWVKDRREGKGVFTTSDGAKYSGGWSADKRHGRGVFATPSGNKYVGSWQEDRRSGKGTLVDALGTYDGEWENDRPHGRGKFTSASKQTFEGYWKAGLREGKGTLTREDGSSAELTFIGDHLDRPTAMNHPPALPEHPSLVQI